MIRFKTGNILDSSAQCLVNTVNCEGFMGKGIAYQFKERFPENNRSYMAACKNRQFSTGQILFFEEAGKVIANFPTKNRWREKSRYSYIESGLTALSRGISERHISSVAIPPLGCGNGGLDWNVVKDRILDEFKDSDAEITVFEPSEIFTAPEAGISKMSASHLILMKLKGGLRPVKFNKLRLQKAAYLLNVFSGTDYFKFEEYKFGPYAHSIEILSRQIKVFQDSYHTDTAGAERILYSNIISDSVKSVVEKYSQTVVQTTHFVNSVVSDKELETAATVISIIRQNPQFSDDEIIEYFFHTFPKYNKERFSENGIRETVGRLVKSEILTKQLIGYSVSSKPTENPLFLPEYRY